MEWFLYQGKATKFQEIQWEDYFDMAHSGFLTHRKFPDLEVFVTTTYFVNPKLIEHIGSCDGTALELYGRDSWGKGWWIYPLLRKQDNHRFWILDPNL